MPALLSIFLLVLAANLAADDARPDDKQIQGTWKILSFDLNGNQAPIDVREKLRVTFQDNKLIVKGSDEDKQFQFSLDPDTNPKSIDLMHIEGDEKGKTSRGIYNLDGKTLTVCMGEADGARPSGFRSGDNVALVVFERTE